MLKTHAAIMELSTDFSTIPGRWPKSFQQYQGWGFSSTTSLFCQAKNTKKLYSTQKNRNFMDVL